MGNTLAILNAFGYIPVCNIWFIIKVKGMHSSFLRLFTIVLYKPSQPEPLLLSKLFIMFKISSSVTILNSILILVGDQRYFFFVCSINEVVNMNAIGQIFFNCGKKVLKELAMSTS